MSIEIKHFGNIHEDSKGRLVFERFILAGDFTQPSVQALLSSVIERLQVELEIERAKTQALPPLPQADAE